jgi:hypothetical protein
MQFHARTSKLLFECAFSNAEAKQKQRHILRKLRAFLQYESADGLEDGMTARSGLEISGITRSSLHEPHCKALKVHFNVYSTQESFFLKKGREKF